MMDIMAIWVNKKWNSSYCKHDGYNGDMDKQEMA
jgi:hypothetical protein